MTSEYRHIPVLLSECMMHLKLDQGDRYVDATLGGAGHALAAARLIGRTGHLIGIDQDEVALSAAHERLEGLPREVRPELDILYGNFGELNALLVQAEVPSIDAILFDLGVSSVQIDTPSRGFSFKESGPLDMRMDPSNQTLTAAEIINTYNAADLARVIQRYSDERWASRIAEFVVKMRQESPITKSEQLVEVIKAAIPASARRNGGHPAKRTFQALRIEVNGELNVLKRGLEAAIAWLAPGGRIAVMSYHSLEDRIVKDLFKQYSTGCTCPPELPVCVCGNKPILKVVTRKPIVPSKEEVEKNPRARSAKLRVAERLDDTQ